MQGKISAVAVSRETAARRPSQPFFPAQPTQPLPLPEESAAVLWLEHWRTARRNWKLIALGLVCGSALGVLVAALQTRLYHAQTTIEIQGITDNVLKARDGNPNSSSDSEITDIQTQVHILQSQSLLRAVLHRLEKQIDVSEKSRKYFQQAASSLHVVAQVQTRLIEISADSSDPQVATDFVNTVADQYIEQHVESRWESTDLGARKLALALEEMRARFERSEDALQSYARDSKLLITEDRNSVSEDKLREVQTELSRAQADRVQRESRMAAINASPVEDLAAVLNDPTITTMQDQLIAVRREIAELSTTYTPDYSKVRKLQAQVAPLEAAIQKRLQGITSRVRSDYQEARRREDLILAAYEQQASLVSGEAEKKIHYDVLKREVESNRVLYDTMLTRVKEASIASALRASNVRVLDPALKPEKPSQPRPLQLVMMGMLTGLCLGTAFVISREQINQTIQAPGDISLFLDIPEFGVVPAAKQAELPLSSVSLAMSEPHSGLADSFRSIVASLLFSASGGGPRVLVITSANPAEGKTTVITNLAMAIAEIGKSVLLIDGDLRSPRLHDIFRTAEENGLSDLLASPAPLTPAAVQACIRHAGTAPLHLITCGSREKRGNVNFHSPRLAELFEYSRKNFDIVLIDSPPMLQIPDARVMGRVADSVVMVVRAGKTARDAAQAVRQRLVEDGTTMTGSVLNDWNPRYSPGYYGKYYYGARPAAYKG